MEKYLYTVNPRIPIRNVIPGQLITRETNVSLDLEQVKTCLKHGPVYRKFANANQYIQVTLENCEKLHQRDYEQHTDNKVEEPKKKPYETPELTEIPPVDENIVEETPEVPTEPVLKETIAEEEIEVPDEEPVEELVDKKETVVEETPEVPTEPVEEVVNQEEVRTNNYQNNGKKYYNSNGKKYKK